MAYCTDCGPAGVPHWIEKFSVRMDGAVSLLSKPPELIWRAIKPFVARMRLGRLAPAAAHTAAALGLGKIVNKPDEAVNWRTRVLWEEAVRRGIKMQEFRPFGLARELFFAEFHGDTVAFDGLPRPRAAHETSLSWMDDKGIIIKKFRRAGVPVPRGRACASARDAVATFTAIGGPVIAKPNLGSRSRHTYVGLTDESAVRRAFAKAQELSPYVVIEEELIGYVFRITLVSGRIAGVMRREPPFVTGDGKHTVRELVLQENKNPLRHGPIFHEIDLGNEAARILASQKLSLDAVPLKDRMVILHEKVSRSFGASTTEIEDIHPDNVALFIKIAEVLDDPLVGVDFMAENLARSWRDQKCGVIECNSLPFIDLHHYPLKGPARNVAGLVWDMIFSSSTLSG